MAPFVSIVIPALNEEKYLPLLLEDLVNQTETNFEVIVVDGNSNDKTKEKALTFTAKLPLTVIVSPKRNVSHQRNLGAARAKGEYIYFIDADSRVDSDMMKKVGEHIAQQRKLLYLPYLKPSNSNFMDNLHFAFGIKLVVLMNKLGVAFAIGPAIIIEKEFFKKIKGFDEKAYVSEDQNLVIKARKAGVKPIFLSDIQYLFSMRRFESENRFMLMLKYTIFTIITLFKGAVYTNSISYDMGGEKHKDKKL